MNPKKKVYTAFIFVLSVLIVVNFSSCSFYNRGSNDITHETIRYYPASFVKMDLPEKRVDMLRFHHTIECEECYLIGEAVLDILHKEYADELMQGIITYREVNSEYLENSTLLYDYGVMEEDFITHIITEDINQIHRHEHLWLIARDQLLLKQVLRDMIVSYMILL